jgi:hypothetical protein
MTTYIRSGREPFEVSILLVCLLYGVAGLAFYNRVSSTSIRLYPAPGGFIFLAALAVGAVVALYGLFGRHWQTAQGVRTERAGLVMLTGMSVAFAAWTPFAVGARGVNILLFLGVAVAVPCVWRLCQIGRFLQALAKEDTEGAAP